MNMSKIFIPFMALVCLLLTACDKDEIVRPPIEWTWDILTPESVKYVGGSIGWSPGLNFRANGMEGDVVITCTNYGNLSFAETSSESYDCGWATVRIEGNKVKIHFPYNVSGTQPASEEITVIGRDGKAKATAVIGLTRTFESGEPGEQPEPEPVPDAAKFKMKRSGFTTFMQIESYFPAPLDLLTFRITDINDNYTPLGFPDYTQYYDSIVWSADDMPHTFRIYERVVAEGGTEQNFTPQWSSNFFRSGTIKTHLKGYYEGKVGYETSLDVDLHARDFLGIEWGPVVLLNPQNLTTYCLLDTTYEYQVNDILAIGENPYSKIIPVNHKGLSHSDYMSAAQKAIKTIMETNVGNGQNAKGKESLFKCLPEKNVEAQLYWENKTSRMLMLHQIPDDSDELFQEDYYLHIEPKN